MLFLELVSIVIEKSLIARHLISNGHQTDLIDSLLDAHGLNSKEQLFGYVEDLFREVSPLALGVNQGLPGVLFLLLENEIVLLKHQKTFLDVFSLWGHSGSFSPASDFLLKCGVPMKELW